MKKIYLLILVTLAVMTSCLKGEQTNSGMYVYYPSTVRILMADQSLDSICFMTTESGYLTTDTSWMRVATGRDTFKNTYPGYYVNWSIPVTFKPNLTGAPRFGAVKIYSGLYQGAGANYVQVRCLGVTRPSRYYNRNTMMDSTAVLTDSAYACVDSVTFTMYSDWTLTIKDTSWLHSLSATSGHSGVHIHKLLFDKNMSAIHRENMLYLTSSTGVKDTIPVKQLGDVK